MSLRIKLQRDGGDTLWGFRLRGGVDIGEPLVIQRVFTGSPSDGDIQRGDQIVAIDKHDATKLTHQEAHDILKNAGTTVTLAINRVAGAVPQAAPRATVQKKTVTTSSSNGTTVITTTTHTSSSHAANSRKVTTMAGQSMPKKFSQVVMSPVDNLPMSVFESAATSNSYFEEDQDKERERQTLVNQPYRTLPLVLPSAKVKRDAPAPAQSYLRLQPNYASQTTPTSSPVPPHPVVRSVNESLLQQKDSKVFDPHTGWRTDEELEQASAVLEDTAAPEPVTDTIPQPQVQPSAIGEILGHQLMVVHKQFNSPLNLYSPDNVAKTIQQQTGVLKSLGKPTAAVNPEPAQPRPLQQPLPEPVSALGPSVKAFDPHQSPTYQALIEENEKQVTTEMRPPVAKVYTVPKAPKIPAPDGRPKKNPADDANSLGMPQEKIYQSYSFNKIMADVLGESEF